MGHPHAPFSMGDGRSGAQPLIGELEPASARGIVWAVFACQRNDPVRPISLVVAATALSLALAACSKQTEQTASNLAESAASDTAHNADKAGDAVAGAADNVGAAASNAARDTADALHDAGRKVDEKAR